MYLAYKNNLKSYSKKYFDAFARRQRVFYTFQHEVQKKINFQDIEKFMNQNDGFITTIAQMNAFFFIKASVVEYAIKHLEDIKRDSFSYSYSLLKTLVKKVSRLLLELDNIMILFVLFFSNFKKNKTNKIIMAKNERT
jgi:hypothetical protein